MRECVREKERENESKEVKEKRMTEKNQIKSEITRKFEREK